MGGSSIADPTAYVATSAKKLRSQHSNPRRTAPMHTFSTRAPLADRSAPGGDDSKVISKQIGWLNKSGLLVDRISYNEVSETLTTIGVEASLKIIKDCENKGSGVKNPTAYILAAAKRVSSMRSDGDGAQWDNKRQRTREDSRSPQHRDRNASFRGRSGHRNDSRSRSSSRSWSKSRSRSWNRRRSRSRSRIRSRSRSRRRSGSRGR